MSGGDGVIPTREKNAGDTGKAFDIIKLRYSVEMSKEVTEQKTIDYTGDDATVGPSIQTEWRG